jgi:uncharacterized membrane protein YczE|tara:strand:- start:277 stop:948 length:672 start_codon:yes stop_codon:yes gene_type:complete
LSRQDLLQLLRPAHKVPRTIWSSRHPLNFRPNFSTLLALVVGLWIFGTGEAVLIAAGIGVSPWTVLAQGITEQTSFTVGEATFIVSVCVLLLWIPLRETPGIGTILNAILIALSIDVMAPFIPEQENLPNAIVQSAFGVMMVGIGSALYLTANLGPGPRDGWMTGVQKKTNWPIGRVRVGIEIIVLSIGILLGGTFGLGTIMFALGIGPAVAISLGITERWKS